MGNEDGAAFRGGMISREKLIDAVEHAGFEELPTTNERILPFVRGGRLLMFMSFEGRLSVSAIYRDLTAQYPDDPEMVRLIMLQLLEDSA